MKCDKYTLGSVYTDIAKSFSSLVLLHIHTQMTGLHSTSSWKDALLPIFHSSIDRILYRLVSPKDE